MKDIWSMAREGSTGEFDSALTFLKKNGGNVDSKNSLGLTPLHIATWRNHLPIVKRLLSARADPDVKDGESGWSSLHRALHFGHLAVAGALMRSGASLTLEDSKSRTPVDLVTGPVSQSVGNDPASVATEVFSWGSGTNYQLGTGNDQIQRIPCKVDALREFHVQVTASAKFHSVAIGSKGELFTWGFGRGGRLGHPDFDIPGGQSAAISPCQVMTGLSSRRVLAVAAAKHHTVIATESGDVLTWGSNQEGQLGYPSVDTQPTPRRVVALRPRIVAVAAANKHSVAVSESGEVFTWGCNKEGQLGYRTLNSASNCNPRVVESLKGRNIKAVSAAKYHTLALSSNGEVFTWGHGLMKTRRLNMIRNATLIFYRTSRFQIIAIAAGMVHSTALARDGSLFYWISSDPNLRHRQMHSMSGKEVVSISAGKYWTAAATSAGDVYLLDGKKYKDEAPVMTRLNGVKNATAVSVGENHLLIICSLYHPPYLSGLDADARKSEADFVAADQQEDSKIEGDLINRKSVPSLKNLSEKIATEFVVEPRNAVSLLEIAYAVEASDLWARCEDIAIRNLSFILTVSAPLFAKLSSEVLAKLERALAIKSSKPWSYRRLPPPTAAAFPPIIVDEDEKTSNHHINKLRVADAFLPTGSTDPDIAKNARAMRKKLQQIEILEAKRSKGQPLDSQQISKLQSRALLESALNDLGLSQDIHEKSSPVLLEGGKGNKKKKKKTDDSQSRKKDSSSKESLKLEFEAFNMQILTEEGSNGEKLEEESSKPVKPDAPDPRASRNNPTRKDRKGSLSMFLNGDLDNASKTVVAAPSSLLPPKRERLAWGGAAKTSKDTTSFRDIQKEQILNKSAAQFVINNKTKSFVADMADKSGNILRSSLQPLTQSNPIPVTSARQLIAPQEIGKSPTPWSSPSGTSPVLSQPSLRDVKKRQAKQQKPDIVHC